MRYKPGNDRDPGLETIFTLSANIMSYLIYKAKVKHRRIDVGSSETVNGEPINLLCLNYYVTMLWAAGSRPRRLACCGAACESRVGVSYEPMAVERLPYPRKLVTRYTKMVRMFMSIMKPETFAGS